MNQKSSRRMRPLASILPYLCALLIAFGGIGQLPTVYAQIVEPPVLPVFCVSQDGTSSPDCEATFTTIQEAVDAAEPYTEIRIATGVYTDTTTRNGTVQSVYITKSVYLQGGYTADNWYDPDPVANPTTVDPQQKGRAFYIVDSTDDDEGLFVSISGLRIVNGTALNAPTDAEDGGQDGGAIRVLAADLTMQDNLIQENQATTGGALSAYSSVLHLFHNEFVQNRAHSSEISAGGALFMHLSAAEMHDNLFEENAASGEQVSGGGAIAADTCLVSMENGNIIRQNRADNAKFALGGGLLFANCDAYLLSTTVDDNSASGSQGSQGGGIYLYSSVPITGSSVIAQGDITNNVAVSLSGSAQGAGLFINQSGTMDEPVYVIANAISANRVESQRVSVAPPDGTPSDDVEDETGAAGGGLQATESVVVLGQNHIDQNEALAAETDYVVGGGLSFFSSAAYLEQNTVVNNLVQSGHAAGGGGISLLFSAVALNNTIINGNSADGKVLDGGAGMYALESLIQAVNTVVEYNKGGALGAGLLLDGHNDLAMHFHHSTIRDNGGDEERGDGSGITLWDGELALRNSLISSQRAGVIVRNDSTIAIDGVLWHANGADATGEGTILMSHSYGGDPLFVDDFHIAADSAAVDRGVADDVEWDIDGDLRGEVADLGADEYVEILPVPEPTAPPTEPTPPPAPTAVPAARVHSAMQQPTMPGLPDPAKIPTLPELGEPASGEDGALAGIGVIDGLSISLPFADSGQMPVTAIGPSGAPIAPPATSTPTSTPDPTPAPTSTPVANNGVPNNSPEEKNQSNIYLPAVQR